MLVDMLRSQGVLPLALVAPATGAPRAVLADIPLWHDEAQILTHHPDEVELINGIGSLPGNPLRAELFARYRALGYRFARVVSAKAMVSDYAVLEEGVQVMVGAIIQAGTRIGANSIINTGAIVEHDCMVGNNSHIAPRAVLCGDVTLGEYVHVGSAATIIQGVKVGNETVIGAGSILTSDLSDYHILYPARSYLAECSNRSR